MYLSWRFFQKRIFPVFIMASGAVRTTPSLWRHIFMRSLIWCWWAFAKKRQIKKPRQINQLYSTIYSTILLARYHGAFALQGKILEVWLQLIVLIGLTIFFFIDFFLLLLPIELRISLIQSYIYINKVLPKWDLLQKHQANKRNQAWMYSS